MHKGKQTKAEVEFGLQPGFTEGTASTETKIRDRLLWRAQWRDFSHGGFILARDHAGISPQQENGTRVSGTDEADNFLAWSAGRVTIGQCARAHARNSEASVPISGYNSNCNRRPQPKRQRHLRESQPDSWCDDQEAL